MPDAEARWLNAKDADIMRSTSVEIRINEDGTYTSDYETKFEVKSEVGRKQLGTYSTQYNARSARLTVLDAYTVNGSERFPVPKEYIEDKPLSTSAEGFDQINRVTIAYPRVEVGSVLWLKVRTENVETEIPNFFSDTYSFGSDVFDSHAHVHIVSRLPLFNAVNDPRHKIALKTETDKDGHSEVTIDLKEPYSEMPIDEKDPYLTMHERTWVVVSSQKTFPAMAAPLVKPYNDTIDSPLPPVFEAIRKKVSTMKPGTAQMNQVTSLMSEQVRYMGDWRTVRGGYIPHSLETIARLRFGDCKDLATVTAAILRRLGYNANVAWIRRGNEPTEIPPLPLVSAFNHAIVWVKDGDKSRWIDATNLASFAQGVPEDILGRWALILDPKNVRLEQTPPGKPSDAEYIRKYEISFKSNGDADLKTTIGVLGRAALPWTASALKASRQVIDHSIVAAVADNKLVTWSKVEDYDLTSRITQDINIEVGLGVANYGMKTTGGLAYALDFAGDTIMNLDIKDRVSGIFINWPGVVRSTYELKGVHKVGRRDINCSLQSPWFTARRKVYQKGADVVIEDEQAFLQPLLTLNDLASERFQSVQKQLRDCFYRVAVLVNAIAK